MTDRALDFLTYMVFYASKCNGAECKFCVYSDNPCGVTNDRNDTAECTVDNRNTYQDLDFKDRVFLIQKGWSAKGEAKDIHICVKGIREYFMED